MSAARPSGQKLLRRLSPAPLSERGQGVATDIPASADTVALSKESLDPGGLVRRAGELLSREEAEFLLLGITGWYRHEIYTRSRKINKRQAERFWWMVRQAHRGVPVQYLVQQAPFLDFAVHVDERVFIPRPETEELVLRASVRVRSPRLILDYGTGSGCIAIALARMFSTAAVWAVDISPAALAVARRNIRRHQLQSRVRTICLETLTDDRLDFLRGKLDILIANPPYIPRERLGLIDRRVRDYEPRLSVDGGPGGTAVVEMLLSYGPGFLKPGGLLALEVDHTQEGFVRTRLPGAEIEKDFAGYVRYVFWQNRRCANGR